MTTQNFHHKLTAILNADVVSYSRLIREDEEGTVRTLTTYRELMSALIEKYHGRVVDSPGDNILAEFGSVRDAVLCAVEIQKELRTKNSELPEKRKMEFRIGINTGDVIQDGDRIYGDGVNVAARIESLADAGGICLSRSAYDQVKRKTDIQYEYIGEHEVKNIDEPVRVYKVLMESIPDDVLQKEKSKEPVSIETKTSSLSEKPSIVVLPFVNISGDPEQEYFSDGMTEEIINALANVKGLKVISRTSSFFFKGKDVNLRTVGEKLNVDNVIEGSVRKAGNRLRITAQLIEVDDDTHLWSDTYNRELEDVFAIQEEISNAIVDTLKIKLLGKEEESLVKTYTENTDAYESYIKGRYFYTSFRGDRMEKALQYYEQAITLDPAYAPAYSAIAEYYWSLSMTSLEVSKNEMYTKAREAIDTALRIDNNLSEAHANLGLIKFFYEWDFKGAEKAFGTAIELNPGLSKPHYDYAIYLAGKGDNDRSILEARKAVELDPLSGTAHVTLGFCLNASGKFDQAMPELRHAREMMPTHFPCFSWLVVAYIRKGMFEEATEEINEGLRVFPSHPILVCQKGSIHALKGEKEKAQEILVELLEKSKEEDVPPVAFSMLYADLGELDKVLEYLEEGYEKRDIYSVIMKGYLPHFLLSDPRVKAFFKKIGL